MTISMKMSGSRLNVKVEGRIDSVTAPELEAELKKTLNDVNELIFDFAKLEYMSSAGLRLILSSQKVMARQGSMVIKNANDIVMEIFDLTGMTDVLTIE